MDAHLERHDALVFLSRDGARTGGAARRREAERSRLHEQPDGEPAPDDGDVLSPDEVALQDPDGGAGVPFRHLRDQIADRSSRVRSERGADSRAAARRRVRRCDQEDIEALLEKQGDEIALVLFAGVNFFTGQLFDIAEDHRRGAEARLHRRDRSRARRRQRSARAARLECRFRRLVFLQISQLRTRRGRGRVRARAARDTIANLPRLAGWWGNDPATRFRMQLEPEFVPVPSADAWQVSNPPIFSMAPLRASFAIFDEAGGMEALRAKSIKLTGYLQFLLDQTSRSASASPSSRRASLTSAAASSRFSSTNIRRSYSTNSRPPA